MGLERFVEAHKKYFEIAYEEIKNGKKESHWMWYIFPQIKGLGHSEIAKYYAIQNLEEAKEFIEDEYLGGNLIRISKELLNLKTDDALQVFGYPDNLKLKSCMTLFYSVSLNVIFEDVLKKYFGGKEDNRTIKILDLI